MSDATSPKQPWHSSAYLRIVAASYDAGELVVRFADGTVGRVDVERMTRVQARRPDWPSLTFNDYEVIVPTAEGDFEVSSFGIRSLSDPVFDAYLKAKEAESARRVGRRLQEFRRSQGLTLETVAERAGMAPSSLSRIEQGDHDGNLIDLDRVLDALGRDFKDLIGTEAEGTNVADSDPAEPEPSPVAATP